MNQSKITVRYAKALFELAREKKVTEAVKKDMAYIQIIAKSVEDFQFLIESPIIKSSKKQEIFRLMFGKSVEKITLDFLFLILKNRREVYISDIARNFLDLARRDLGIKSASFVSAIEINAKSLEEIKRVAEKLFNTKIEIALDVKPEILGGFVLRVEDQQFDASIATKLNYIRRHLVNDEFEMKL